MPRLTLYTLNTWSGLTYRGLVKMKEYETPIRRELRFCALLEELRREQPDVVMLNEANPMPAYGKRLGRELSMDVCWHMGVAGLRAGALGLPWNLREGDLIAADRALGLQMAGRKHLSGPGVCGNVFSCHFGNLTQAVLSRITLPQGTEAYLCATHWTAQPAIHRGTFALLPELAARWGFSKEEISRTERRLHEIAAQKHREAVETLRFLHGQVPQDVPVILAGDFNSELSWPELRLLEDAGFFPVPLEDRDRYSWDPQYNENLKDYYEPETHRKQRTLFEQLDALEEMTRRTIDHVFVKNIPVRHCKARLCMGAVQDLPPPADHFGVCAQLHW